MIKVTTSSKSYISPTFIIHIIHNIHTSCLFLKSYIPSYIVYQLDIIRLKQCVYDV